MAIWRLHGLLLQRLYSAGSYRSGPRKPSRRVSALLAQIPCLAMKSASYVQVEGRAKGNTLLPINDKDLEKEWRADIFQANFDSLNDMARASNRCGRVVLKQAVAS